MFKPVSSKASFPQMEERVLQFWKEEDVFHQTEKDSEGAPIFMLYEGPPTANGAPGIHHVLARAFKDVICRYKTMKGYRCVRKGGWDTHGLPVELEVEKELGLVSKRDIEEYGIERFNQRCRESVFRYVKEWETLTDRIGFWVDMEHPYITLDKSYIETGWWVINQLWDQGLVFQDMRGTPHCPRCVTSLSSHEVALGYQEDTPDPSVFVKFRLSGWDETRRGCNASDDVYGKLTAYGEPVYFLAWTTTPWTLPGNTALAVDATAEYNLVEAEGPDGKEKLLLASALTDKVIQGTHRVLARYPGRDLVALTYEPLYDPMAFGVEMRQFEGSGDSGAGGSISLKIKEQIIHRVVAADFVSMEDGTGIVHIAPAFGDEDLNLGRQEKLGFVQHVDLQGIIIGGYPFAGKFVKDADEEIMDDLVHQGLLYHRSTYRHTYPFCWRCGTPLLYYAKSSWYIRTTARKERMVSANAEINWNPSHIRDGRFGEWLRNNVDWAISRERYWGTPIPIWQCGNCGDHRCVGSVSELKELALLRSEYLEDQMDLHRPYVDAISLPCSKCNGEMRRIPEVMDAWFDSGIMPFAQWHVPHDLTMNQLRVEGRFPADYICEAVDQTRGWFYSLHSISVLLTGQPSYRNVICLGHILDQHGQKMSKHVGNVIEPWGVLDAHGADAVRWYLFTAGQPGDSRRFSSGLVSDVVRRFLLTLWNVYSFFTTYASIDRFHPDQVPPNWKPAAELDRWIISELNALVADVDGRLEAYDPTGAGKQIEEFVSLLSNWYVRRSRRRFWKSENDWDKLAAYATLYTCLTTSCRLLAPFTPFLAEEMYQNLERKVRKTEMPVSVHLVSFPQPDPSLVDFELMEATRLAMRLAKMGRGARSKAGIKVRQPLSRLVVKLRDSGEVARMHLIQVQIMEELNVKKVEVITEESELFRQAMEAENSRAETMIQIDSHSVALDGGYMVAVDIAITAELLDEGIARELVHRIQNLRRAAGFELTDRIVTFFRGPEGVARVMGSFGQYIKQETLSEDLVPGEPMEGSHSEMSKIEGSELVLGVKRL
jgi:isoleucyl-tRNA synthetase